jgi:ribosomal protein L29
MIMTNNSMIMTTVCLVLITMLAPTNGASADNVPTLASRRRLAKLNVGHALQLGIDLTKLKTQKQQIVNDMADIKTQLHMDRRRLAEHNVGLELRDVLADLEKEKKMILLIMRIRPEYTPQYAPQLGSIEKEIARIKTQLHMDRRRLAEHNVGLELRDVLADLEKQKQHILLILRIRPWYSQYTPQLRSIEKEIAHIKTQLHMDRRRLAQFTPADRRRLAEHLAILETQKQQLLDSMRTRQVNWGKKWELRPQQLRSIEK